MSDNSLILQTLLGLKESNGRIEQKVDNLTVELGRSNARIKELEDDSGTCKLAQEGTKKQILGMTTATTAIFAVITWVVKDFFLK